jgi:SPP1 family predicted phage head-tail adaptor
MQMRPGKLRELVTIEEEQTQPDGSGGFTLTWEAFAQVYAHVRPVRLTESERQGAMRASRGYVFTMRRRDDLSEDMRIMWNSQPFNIREIRLPAERELYMEVFAQSGVTQ